MFKGNMTKMLKQAQEMQKQIEVVQSQLSDIIIDAESGGGMVQVKINGHLEILELRLSDNSLKEDKEIVEDLIISATNKAIADAQALAKEKMNSVTGGMLSGLNIPGNLDKLSINWVADFGYKAILKARNRQSYGTKTSFFHIKIRSKG